jgi:hypothetical protein
MLELLNSWKESSAVPKGWTPASPPGALTKVPIKNRMLLNLLRSTLPGRWSKVYHIGRDGTELHYFQHASGKVAFVKHKVK